MPAGNPDPAGTAERWRTRGFSFGIYTDPPGQVWSDFVHDTDELLMVIQGDMELEMRGKTIRCEIGEEVLIPARVVHTVRNVGRTGSQWAFGYKRVTQKS